MSVINSQPLIGASGNQGGAYNLTKSLRTRASASAYLNRTPASAGNRQTFTYSTWIKRGAIGVDSTILSAGNNRFVVKFSSADNGAIRIYEYNGSTFDSQLITTALFRDPSAWYHFVLVADTTQATASNRIKVYINGAQLTSFSTANYPSQNFSLFWNSANANYISAESGNANFYDGYLTEVNFIDGQALTPSSFGETDAATGVWIPKAYTGTYGTNGFYLDFEDTSSTAALGYDAAGSNDWTVNNVSLTSGATYDSMTDVPTLTSATAANYCTLNPLNFGTNAPVNGNLAVNNTSGAGVGTQAMGTLGVSSGKYYFEMRTSGGNANCSVGVFVSSTVASSFSSSNGRLFRTNDGQKATYPSGTVSAYGSSAASGSVIGCAFDITAGKIWFSINNTWQASGDPAAGTNAAFTDLTGEVIPFAGTFDSLNTGSNFTINFGQQPFAYTPPTGFVALNTFNLPTPTIGATASTQANKYFEAAVYAGDGSSTRTITTSPNFTPDLYWLKNRTDGFSHLLYDRLRGAGENADLSSNSTAAEGDNNTNSTYGYVSAFTSNGITVEKGSNSVGYTNTSGHSYVAWQWNGGNSSATNTAGSITSTVRANTSTGFSVVTWTGTGSGAATVGHGLGVAPKFIITKPRGISADWICYNENLGNNAYLVLNSTAAQVTGATTVWGSTSPTSTVFSLGSGYNYSTTMVAYCFAEVAGYSKFGSYVGNGSTDGIFVYTGFRPKFIMIKRTSGGTGSWAMYDTSRNTFNVSDKEIAANESSSEYTRTEAHMDILSNGFKLRNTDGWHNVSGSDYIYMAVAESPFKYANAR